MKIEIRGKTYEIGAGVDLRGANLHDVYLGYADLHGADLHNADLHGANLSYADLSGANLHSANLSYADLSYADLRGANLRGADLSYASGYVDLGRDTRGYHFRAVAFPLGWQITAGCRDFTIDEALAHWREAHNEDALARVAILKAHPLPHSFAGIGA